MRGYLHKLATRALGQHSAAKPRLTPLFGEAPPGPIDDGAATTPDDWIAPRESEPVSNLLSPSLERSVATTRTRPPQADAIAAKPAESGSEPVASLPAAATMRRVESMPEAGPHAEALAHTGVPALPLVAPPRALPSAIPQRHDQSATAPSVRSAAPGWPDAVAVAAQVRPGSPGQRSASITPGDAHVSRAESTPASATARLGSEQVPLIASIGEAESAHRRAEAPVAIAKDVDASRSAVPVIALQSPRATRGTEPMSSITHRRGPSIPPASLAPIRPVVEPATVNVTIGRVEVRAAASPAPTPPRQHAASTPTHLELYLQRRGKGMRS